MILDSLKICTVHWGSMGMTHDFKIVPVLASDEEEAIEKVTKWFNEDPDNDSYEIHRIYVADLIL